MKEKIRRVDFTCLNGDNGTLQISADASIRIEHKMDSLMVHFLGKTEDYGKDDCVYLEVYPSEVLGGE